MRCRAIAAAVVATAAAAAVSTAAPAQAEPGLWDTVPPEVQLGIPASPGQGVWAGWYKEPVTMTVNATDNIGVGLIEWVRRGAHHDDGKVGGQGTTLTFTQQGVTDVEVVATDFSGRMGGAEYGVGLDLTDPTIAFGGSAANGQPIRRGEERRLEIACADVPTAVISCQARIGQDRFGFGEPVPTAANGTYAVHVTAFDAVGRWTEKTFTYTVVDPLLQVVDNPSIAGNPTSATVGQTLTAAGGTFTPTATRVDYHWKVGDNAPVTAPTYEVKPEDVGKRISLYATGHRAEHVVATTPTVGNVLAAAGTLQATGRPTVIGTAREGEALTIVAAGVTPAPQLVENIWTVDGKELKTDPPVLRLSRDHAGKTIQCRQRFSKPGYTPLSVPCVFADGSDRVTVAAPSVGTTDAAWSVLTPAAIKGKATVGKRLRAVRPQLSGPATSYAYQWLRNGKPIAGATGPTYKLKKTDAKRKVTVQVTASTAHRPDTVSVAKAKKVGR
ncbi:hypothetical protein KVF89_15040 [Nocardioides carbamazepini]|uniref:hypothetical protein n=1 Tax=Nocardioides carbamazepini TaxID=2854259 RepID=UPI00214A6674|nr:hypothetical protein [Nocardioides carbamazepini]MCR1783854.1 hypothetical protein [Nocardioides carbamazepini]